MSTNFYPKFPYVEHQRVWGHELDFYVADQRCASWYCAGQGGTRADWDRPSKDLIRPGMCVLDVGANVGHTTIVFAKAVGPRGLVVAVEPDPANINLLRHNCALNDLDHDFGKVSLFEAAASDRAGRLPFAGEMVVAPGNHQDVEANRLDQLTKYHGPFDVVKMDVEGYELAALRGCAGLFNRHSPAFEIELHLDPPGGVHMTRHYGFDPEDIMAFFLALGYRLYTRGYTPAPLKPVTICPTETCYLVALPPNHPLNT